MENVTEARGIVRRVEEPGRADGDVLFVYRRDRRGNERWHCRLEPDQEFSPSLLDRFRELVGYKVHTGPVVHRFSQRYEQYRQGHSFTLHYRLEVAVADPEAVKLGLSRDPLGILQRQVEDLVGGAVKRQPWEEIAGAPTEAGYRALDTARRDHREGVGPPIAQVLDDRALELGFQLVSLDVDCELDEQAAAGPVADAEADAKIARTEANKRVEIVETETSADVEEVRLRRQTVIDHLQVERQNFLNRASRFDELATKLLAHFDRALGGVAGQIDDVSGLTATVEELARLHRSISGLVEAETGETDRKVSVLTGAEQSELSALPEANGLRACDEFLREAVTQVSALNGDATEKRGWLAYILRLTAAVLDEGTEPEEIEQLHDDFKPRYKASARSLRSDDQRRFFSRLRQPEHLRSRLLVEEE